MGVTVLIVDSDYRLGDSARDIDWIAERKCNEQTERST